MSGRSGVCIHLFEAGSLPTASDCLLLMNFRSLITGVGLFGKANGFSRNGAEMGGWSKFYPDFAGNLNLPKAGHTGVILDSFGSVPSSV